MANTDAKRIISRYEERFGLQKSIPSTNYTAYLEFLRESYRTKATIIEGSKDHYNLRGAPEMPRSSGSILGIEACPELIKLLANILATENVFLVAEYNVDPLKVRWNDMKTAQRCNGLVPFQEEMFDAFARAMMITEEAERH